MTRRNPRTPAKKQSPECPDCGHAYCTQVDNGWSNDHTILIRLYTCPENCPVFLSAEMVLPTSISSIGQFDENYRERRKLYSRKKQNYYGTKIRGGAITRSARIIGNLTVTPAKRYGYPEPVSTIRTIAGGSQTSQGGRPRAPYDPKLEHRREQYRQYKTKKRATA